NHQRGQPQPEGPSDGDVALVCDGVFFNATATTEIYTLSLHDALPIYVPRDVHGRGADGGSGPCGGQCERERVGDEHGDVQRLRRSEEHTSELQSRREVVCRLVLEKKDWDGG